MRVQELLHHAKEHGKKLLALESSAQAEAFRLLLATVERAGEEAHLATEVNGLQLMVEGQTKFDREKRLFEELRLQDAHDEVHRLRKEQETPKKLKGKKKKKKTPSRTLRDRCGGTVATSDTVTMRRSATGLKVV
jgi:hypothetical protein